MELYSKLLFVATYLLLLHQRPVTSHKHKHELENEHEETSKEQGVKKDILSPAIGLATSIASTYLLNWLKKTQSLLANINNLSSDYLIFDKCDGMNVEISGVPTDLLPGQLGTEMKSFNPAG